MNWRALYLTATWVLGSGAGCASPGAEGELFITDSTTGLNYNLQRGQHFQGKTTFCFAGAGDDFLDPMVMSYDHDTGDIVGPVKVGENPLAPAGDDHGNPALLVDQDGFIHVAYGGHGFGDDRHQNYARSSAPGDITSWDHLDNVEPGATYPNFLILSDGTIYLIYRDGFHEHDWVFQTSTDNGDSWGLKVRLLAAGTRRDDGIYHEGTYYDSWYANGWGFYAGHHDNTIHAMFKYHAHTDDENESDQTHAYQLQRKSNVYYIRMQADGGWVDAAGDTLTLPVTREVAESRCRVFESNPKKGFNQVQKILLHGISTDDEDVPYLHFSDEAGDLEPRLIRLGADGAFEYPALPGRGDFVVTSRDVIDMYPDRHQHRTEDGGLTWQIVRSIPEGVPFTGMLLHKFHPDAKRLLYDWTNETQPLYLWGDGGLVSR